MYREYEIFEVMPDGSVRRAALVPGLEFSRVTLSELAKRTRNECFAADTNTRQVVAQMKIPDAKWRSTKRIFQIAYNEQLGDTRAELLRQKGYSVISVVGNDKAELLLASIRHYDLFIVGHAAPEETRREMAERLK